MESSDLRIKPDYKIDSIHEYLNQKQIDLLSTFRTQLSQSAYMKDEHCQAWCTDATLCRFLRARDWDLKSSMEQLTNTLKWRLEYLPHKIIAEDVRGELNNTGKMYRNGFDKFNRPILYMKPGLDNTGADVREQKVKYLVYIMEKCAIAANKNNREKLFLLIDFKDNKAAMGSIQTAQEILAILQNYYPESLGRALIFNAPWSFSLFWGMISPFLQKVTSDKIQFVDSVKVFLEYIDEKELEVMYGGKNTWKYDYATHWDKEEK